MEVAEIWKKFQKNKDAEAKDKLIQHYLPLVRGIALGIIKKLPSSFELDDLVSDGVFGLIKSIEQFDTRRGVKFETYATAVIRGSILNGLRALDWVPERTRGKTRALQKAMEKFTVLYGRPGTTEELAEELDIASEEVYELINELGSIYLLSLDQPTVFINDEESFSILDMIEDSNKSDPLAEIEFKDLRENLRQSIKVLDERDQLVITRHYFEGVSFEEIARQLKVSKQRISQMHARAIRKLRDKMKG